MKTCLVSKDRRRNKSLDLPLGTRFTTDWTGSDVFMIARGDPILCDDCAFRNRRDPSFNEVCLRIRCACHLRTDKKAVRAIKIERNEQ